MSQTSEMELGLLQRRARACGMYVNRHKVWDAARGTGDLYLMEQKTRRNCHPPTIISYANVSEIENALSEIESDTFGKLAHVR
jgi:hypothetical protein